MSRLGEGARRGLGGSLMWSKCDRTLSAFVKSESLEQGGEKKLSRIHGK